MAINAMVSMSGCLLPPRSAGRKPLARGCYLAVGPVLASRERGSQRHWPRVDPVTVITEMPRALLSTELVALAAWGDTNSYRPLIGSLAVYLMTR